MNKWTNPELEELSLSLTAGNGHGNTGDTGKNNPNYKTKTQHYEEGYSTNFVLAPETTDYGYTGEDTSTEATEGTSL